MLCNLPIVCLAIISDTVAVLARISILSVRKLVLPAATGCEEIRIQTAELDRVLRCRLHDDSEPVLDNQVVYSAPPYTLYKCTGVGAPRTVQLSVTDIC